MIYYALIISKLKSLQRCFVSRLSPQCFYFGYYYGFNVIIYTSSCTVQRCVSIAKLCAKIWAFLSGSCFDWCPNRFYVHCSRRFITEKPKELKLNKRLVLHCNNHESLWKKLQNVITVTMLQHFKHSVRFKLNRYHFRLCILKLVLFWSL